MSGSFEIARVRAVSLFSLSVEENARDTQMTTRVTEGERREGHDKRETTLFSSRAPALVSRVSRHCRLALARACTPLTNLKKKRGCSQFIEFHKSVPIQVITL